MRLNNLPTHPLTGLVSGQALLSYGRALRHGHRSVPFEAAMLAQSRVFRKLGLKLRDLEIKAAREQRFREYHS